MQEALDDHELRGLFVCLENHGGLTQLYVFMSSYACMTCSFLALSKKHTTKLEIVYALQENRHSVIKKFVTDFYFVIKSFFVII